MLTLTNAAATRIKAQLAQRGQGLGIRLEVKPTGCSGWAYKLDYADEIGPAEQCFERDGAKLVVPEKSLAALNGTVVDFVQDGFNHRWQFQNPNVDADCGCGESFSLREEAKSS